MKFFTVLCFVGLVALVSAAEKPAQKLESVQEAEPSVEASRTKRGLLLNAYTAPVAAAAVPAVPAYAAAYAAPVATYSAYATALPYSYSYSNSYRAYPAYSYPAYAYL